MYDLTLYPTLNPNHLLQQCRQCVQLCPSAIAPACPMDGLIFIVSPQTKRRDGKRYEMSQPYPSLRQSPQQYLLVISGEGCRLRSRHGPPTRTWAMAS